MLSCKASEAIQVKHVHSFQRCSAIDCSGAVVTSKFPGRRMVVYHFGIYKKAQKECS
jgi:hypothetical protein